MKIWTNGCFDLIHHGHIALFEFGKSQGDTLYVGIDSDLRVKELKGENRPVNNQEDRRRVLESIRYVDKVFIFNTKEEMERILIENGIDLIVIGDDYLGKEVTGSHLCEVRFFPKIPNISSSSILKRLE